MSEKLSDYANYELGEAFFDIMNSMVIRDGIPVPGMEPFEFVSPKWRKLADKKHKNPDDIKKIDEEYRLEIRDMADSCIIYMAAKINKKTFEFNIEDYTNFLQLTNVDKDAIPNDNGGLESALKRIRTQFTKLANHGEASGDNLIDNRDMAAYIYALDMKIEHNENNEFAGVILNGRITPMDYAVAYRHLKEDEDNLFSLKLRQAYKNLFGSEG